MSKLTDMLSKLGQTPPAGLGFGAATAREKTPLILLAAPAGVKLDVDFRVAIGASKKPAKLDGLWGVSLADASDGEIEALKDAGCDFVIVESASAPGALLQDDDMGRGYVLPREISDREARAIEEGPFDFLVVDAAGMDWPLTVGGALKILEQVSMFSRHVFLRVDCIPSPVDLKLLRDMPISGILLSSDAAKRSDAKDLKSHIGELEPRPRRHRPTALLPGQVGSLQAQSEYDDDEDDDLDEIG